MWIGVAVARLPDILHRLLWDGVVVLRLHRLLHRLLRIGIVVLGLGLYIYGRERILEIWLAYGRVVVLCVGRRWRATHGLVRNLRDLRMAALLPWLAESDEDDDGHNNDAPDCNAGNPTSAADSGEVVRGRGGDGGVRAGCGGADAAGGCGGGGVCAGDCG